MTEMRDPAKNWQAEQRNGKPMRRRGPPPCRICPKRSPTVSWLYELSDKNAAAVAHWQRHRAMNFNGLTDAEKADGIVQRNFAIIDDVYRAFEAAEAKQMMLLTVQSATQAMALKMAAKR